MKILIAEDDPISRRMLEHTLRKWDYDVTVTCDGKQAWEVLERDDAPDLAILDWMMPELDGVEVCRRVRSTPGREQIYLIMMTARNSTADIVTGLETGADEYITKPFDREELRARLNAGRRIVELQSKLADRVRELEQTLAQVKQLHGLLPICCYCKRIRSDQNYWQQLEGYLSDHADVRFSHGICPECFTRATEEQADPAAETSGAKK
jgi:sigma-B regulation protein RsbU (phosphoserine phosphatase)